MLCEMDDSCKTCDEIEFLFSRNTEFYADSVEWCPFSLYAEFLVCGTYQLEENEASDNAQTRKGSVILYKLSFSEEGEVQFDQVSTFYCNGILDMKWCPRLIENCALLAVACSDGQILLLKLCNEGTSVHLSQISHVNLAENARNMVLSLDWSSEPEEPLKIIASDTLGCLNYLEVIENDFSLLNSWKAHTFQAWISAFDYSQQHIVYSGGDDCHLKGWDTRDLSSPTFVSKRHSMGVTAISKSKKSEHLLVTGSYDENVLLWDTRSMKSPVSERSLGGGIWRLKWHPHDPEYLLSASIHNGFHVLSVTNSDLKVIDHYNEHGSLAYGVDWCRLSNQSTEASSETASDRNTENVVASCSFNRNMENFVASCSFYDKLLHVWKINL